MGAGYLLDVPLRHSVSVATSTAQSDSGVFEFSFLDERYMPFEGAGAVSSWELSLPKNFRPFDYQTISDVILHVSYTAEHDGLLRDRVEDVKGALEGTILTILKNNSLGRMFSLRQDFSTAFSRLLHSPADTPVKLEIDEKFLPIFMHGRAITVTKAQVLLRTSPDQSVGSFEIWIKGSAQTGFVKKPNMDTIWSKDLGALFAGGIIGQHELIIKNAGDLAPTSIQPGDLSVVDAFKLYDVMLHIEYCLKDS